MSDRAKKAASELNLWVPDGNLEEAERKAEAIIRKHFPSDDLLEVGERVSPSTPQPVSPQAEPLLVDALQWTLNTLKMSLMGASLRNADEVISYAENALSGATHPSTADLEREAREWLEREGYTPVDRGIRQNKKIGTVNLDGMYTPLYRILAAFVREREKR